MAEMTHYEVLEVAPDAGPEELERAYRLACAAYAEDSMALYSVFSEEDSSELRRRIELAYRVLADSAQRKAYDLSLGSEGGGAEEIDIALDLAADDVAVSRDPFELVGEIRGFDGFDEESEDSFDGAWLRRYRLRCGVEIDQIAAVTKINPSYLRSIEEERFDRLPAAVYVRGFVGAYARCLALDPARVVAGYMKRLKVTPKREPRRPQRKWLGRSVKDVADH
jgi:flagellar biosynthesis protein FlhG